MSSEQAKPKRPLTWELMISTLGFILCAIFLAQKHELFQNLARPLTESTNLGGLLWVSAATVMLALSLRVKRRSKFGRPLRILSLICCSALLLSILALNNSWVRYRVLKTETLSTSLGLSQWGDADRLRRELNRELLQAGPSSFITRDRALLEHLAFENGGQFRDHPTQALIAYTALRNSGVSFQETWQSPQGKSFLLLVLAGEANPEPWYGLDWLKKSELAPQPDLGLYAGLLTVEEAKQILEHHLSTPPDTKEELETLLFGVMNFPSLTEESERVKFFGTWGETLEEKSKFLLQGLEVREQVMAQVSITTPVTLRVEVKDLLTHKTWQDREIPHYLPQVLCSFLRSCDVNARLVDTQEADVTIKATLSDIDLYNYQAPIYGTERVTRRKYRRVAGRSVARHVTEERSVVTGSETKMKQGPGLSFELTHEGQTIVMPPTLFYWRDAIFKEQDREKNSRVVHSSENELFGRTWPYGSPEENYKHRFLQLESTRITEY